MDANDEPAKLEPEEVLRLSVDVVASYLANNSLAADAISGLIKTVHETLTGLDGQAPPPVQTERPKPAISVGRSIQPDYIVCLEDGKKLKMLKRYLRSRYNLTPEEYRRRWNLPPDYPMVAPAYATRRSEFAKQIGLGRGVRRPAAEKAKASRGKAKGR
jgi:predicted transcriptional regulator